MRSYLFLAVCVAGLSCSKNEEYDGSTTDTVTVVDSTTIVVPPSTDSVVEIPIDSTGVVSDSPKGTPPKPDRPPRPSADSGDSVDSQ